MEPRLPVKVLYIRDNTNAARRVEEFLVERGFALSVATYSRARTAAGDRDGYDVLCIDLATFKPGSIREISESVIRDDRPTILITEPDTVADPGQFMRPGPVCFLIRDSGDRYLQTLACLIERLCAAKTLIREKQEIEKTLRQTEDRLFMSQKMEAIGMLTGGIAHDFNNILATILGYASFLKGKAAGDEVFSSGLSAIEDSAERASELTGQLLAYSRVGKAEIAAVSINRVVREVHNIIRKAFDKSITIKLDLDEAIGTVDADIAQLKHIVLDLCIHARDAMPQGGTLTIRTFEPPVADGRVGSGSNTGPGRWVTLSVSDTGAGIDAKAVKRRFEPGLPGQMSSSPGGSGLSVVHQVAKRYGGLVDVTGRPDAGTEFVIRFPASEDKKDAPPPKPEAARGGTETILVIDDETQIVRMLKRLLTDFGYRVLCADSSAEGVRRFEENAGRIDLVVLDIMMPGMGGKEVMERILALRPDTKILLASGYSQQGRHRDLIAMGAAGFIGKPFNVHTLLAKIRTILG